MSWKTEKESGEIPILLPYSVSSEAGPHLPV